MGAKGYSILAYKTLQKLSAEDWLKIKTYYKDWTNKIAFVIPTYAYSIIGIVAILFYCFFHGWIRAIAIGAFFVALIEASKREGHKEGYFDGYGEGHYRGIVKALGLTKEEASVFEDLVNEVEFHSKH